jgi:chorismate mutase
MYVPNDIDFCIRLMAQVLLPADQSVNHPYLRGASKLRADRC